jgi:hypothetical protein
MVDQYILSLTVKLGLSALFVAVSLPSNHIGNPSEGTCNSTYGGHHRSGLQRNPSR